MLMRSKDGTEVAPSSGSLRDTRGKNTAGFGISNSFSDDEDTAQLLSSSRSTARGIKSSSVASRSSQDAFGTSTRGRGTRGRGKGRGSSNLKQTTLDAALTIRRSDRSASVATPSAVPSTENDDDKLDSPSSDEVEEFGVNEVLDSSENEDIPAKGRKRAAPATRGRGRGRGRGATSSNKKRVETGFLF
ncbi:hypothetical protein MKX01_011970 [Papaver californicum]|nr:hypothetical protein MKX01_011970 [Papaver californicum]